MISLSRFREKYPEYNDMGDEEVISRAASVGIQVLPPQGAERVSLMENVLLGAQQGLRGAGRGIVDAAREVAAQGGFTGVQSALDREIRNRDAELAERQERMRPGGLSDFSENPAGVITGAIGNVAGSIPLALTPAGWATIFASQVGNNLQEQGEAQGLEAGQRSLLTAVPTAAVQTGLERMLGVEGFVARGMRGTGAGALGRGTRGAIAGAVGEGVQEGLSETLTIAQGDISNPGRVFDDQNIDRVIEAAGLGAIGGGAVQGGLSAIRGPERETTTTPQNNDTALREALNQLSGVDSQRTRPAVSAPAPTAPTAQAPLAAEPGTAEPPAPSPALTPVAPTQASAPAVEPTVTQAPAATVQAAPQPAAGPTSFQERAAALREQEFQGAVNEVRTSNNPSIRHIQRRFGWGMDKSRRIIQRMEREGILSNPGPDGRRTVLSAAPQTEAQPSAQQAASPAQNTNTPPGDQQAQSAGDPTIINANAPQETARTKAGQVAARRTGADPIHEEDDFALAQSVNAFGRHVYVLALPDGRAGQVDVLSMQPGQVDEELLTRAQNKAREIRKREEEIASLMPDGPFTNSNQTSVGFGERGDAVAKMARELADMMGLENQRFVVIDHDMSPRQLRAVGMVGKYQRGALPMEGFSADLADVGKVDDQTSVIRLSSKLRMTEVAEVVAHELGHIVERTALANAPDSVKRAIKEDFEKFSKRTDGMPFGDFVRALRPGMMAERIPNDMSPELAATPVNNLSSAGYWRSFSEWFADQVARWATTEQRPQTVVEKFFAGIANFYNNLMSRLGDMTGRPAPSVRSFLNSLQHKDVVDLREEWLIPESDQDILPMRDASREEPAQAADATPARQTSPLGPAPQQEPEVLSRAVETMLPEGGRTLPASDTAASPAMPPQADRIRARIDPAPQANADRAEVDTAERLVNEALQKYEGRGQQGRRAAQELREKIITPLRQGDINPDQAVAAFEMADAISDILPSRARQAIEFFTEPVTGRGGNRLQGEQYRSLQRRADGTDGLIRMSIADDQVTVARETAAHEAWHVLEDWLRVTEPQTYRALQRAFPKDGSGKVQMNRIEGGLLRALRRHRHPSGQSYHDYIAGTTDDGQGVFSSPSEAQAIVFGALYDIRRSGAQPIPSGPMRRVLDFFADIIDRLRGRRAARAMNDAVAGGFRQRMGENERPDVRPAQEAPAPDEEPGVAPSVRTSARELPPSVKEASERLSGRAPEQLMAQTMGNRVWSSGIRGSASRFRAKTADMYTILEDMERKLTGDNRLMGSMSGYVAMWRASDTERYLSQMVINGGYPELVKGRERGASYVKINREGKGGLEWLTKLATGHDQRTGVKLKKPDGSNLVSTKEEAKAVMDAFRVYAIAKRGTQLNANGIVVQVGPRERAAAAEAAMAFPEIVPAFEAYQDYNRRLMKLAVDSGVLQQADAEAYMRYNDYYPFYRAAPERDPLNTRKIAGISTKFKPREIVGGSQPFADDPLAVILENSSYWLNASLKNIAMQKVIDTGLRVGVVRPFNKKEDDEDGKINVRVRGVDFAFATDDPDLMAAINAHWMIDPKFQTVARVFGWPGRILREMITKEPGFMLYANPMRDGVAAWVTSGTNFTPIASTYANMLKAVADDPIAMQYRDLGNAGSMRQEDIAFRDPAEIVRGDILVDKGIYRASGPGQLMDLLRYAWLKWDKVSEASDMGSRLAIYQRVREETGDEAEAAWRAREIMNFTKRGQSELIKLISTLVPFTNSRIQGIDVLVQSLAGNRVGDNKKSQEQRQGRVMARMAILASTAVMIAMLTGEDEEVKEAPEFLRNNNVLIPLRMIGLGDSGLLAIPKPFELGLLSMTLPEQMYRLMNGDRTTFGFTSTLASLSADTLVFPVLPPFLVAIGEQAANYSFFTGRPIVGRALSAQPQELQFTAQTPPIYKEIAAAIAESGIPTYLRNYGIPIPGFMTSPERMDHFVRAFAGTVGVQLAVSAGVLAGADSVRPPDWTNLPIISRAFIREGSRQPAGVATLYELIDEANRLTRQRRHYQGRNKAEMVEMITRNGGALIDARPALQAMERRMATLSQRERDLLRQTNIPMEQRRPELESISEEKRATVRAIDAIRLSVGR